MTTPRLPRYRTGDPVLDDAVAALVEQAGAGPDSELVFELVASALRLARDRADRGDLKIANASLREMRRSFNLFAPYRATRKVAIFGSARTRPDDPLYDQARRLATALAEREWMVITGAGPGIMEAGIEGAGPENSFGVGIQLPFEAHPSRMLADDPKLLNFRYFFTRKLSFVKEASGFALLPGGYGTLDEAFELLTLVQTGKAPPAPIVLLDVPGGTYWQSWLRFVEDELLARGYVSPADLSLVVVTDQVEHAVEQLTGFYTNYHSMRFVGDELIIRVQHAPDDARLGVLAVEFADLLVDPDDDLVGAAIRRVDATDAEIADHDALDCERLALRFNRASWSRLRVLVDRLNTGAPTT